MKKSSLLIRTLVFISVLAIGVIVAININLKDYTEAKSKLKVYNPAMLNPELVDSSLQGKGIGHRIQSFKLVNQLGDTITEKAFENKIYVTDFFFTTCTNICPKMSNQLVRVQESFKDNNDFMILSHSVTPEIDSVPILQAYADEHNADPEKWMLVTGDKQQIYDLARKFYFTLKPKEVEEYAEDIQGDFIHTNNFVLIDKQKRIRGFYDGTSKEEVDKLIEDINLLFSE